MEMERFDADSHELMQWITDYFSRIENYPVMSQVEPGDIFRRLPDRPPAQGEPFPRLLHDLQEIVLPGITHWQHPSFFGYFPASSSPISLLAEMATAALAVQAMSWQTSPAAAELEEMMVRWLLQMLSLPSFASGCIQDTASTSTLCSLLSAREQATGFQINEKGFFGQPRFACYCSREAHSSVEKAAKIAGIGRENLRKIDVDDRFAMIPEKLAQMIDDDRAQGVFPLWVAATLGTTGSTAVDPLRKIGEICSRHGIWLHVDAALAGTALILPEMRWMSDGIEYADSLVFNPHKWMFTNFDCSVYLVKNPAALVQTFEISPEYLKTPVDERVNNYRDWGIQLGRRFRALKLWFVIRHFGVEGLREKLRFHIRLAHEFAERVQASGDFEMLAPVPLNTVCFRYKPNGVSDADELDRLNQALLMRLNRTGKVFMSHTKLKGVYTLRLVVGQTRTERHHVEQAWELIRQTARSMAQ